MSANEEVAEYLHRPVLKKLKRRNLYTRFKDKTWTADWTKMGSLSFKNINVRYLLCLIDPFTKYA